MTFIMFLWFKDDIALHAVFWNWNYQILKHFQDNKGLCHVS